LKIHTIVNLPTWYFKLSFFVKVPNFIQIDHFTLTKSSDLIYEFKEKHDEKLRANNLNLKIKLDMLSSYVQRSLSVLNQIIENVKFSLFTISNRFTCKFRKAKLLYVFRVIDGYTFSKRDFKILLRFVNLNFVYTTPLKKKKSDNKFISKVHTLKFERSKKENFVYIVTKIIYKYINNKRAKIGRFLRRCRSSTDWYDDFFVNLKEK